MRSLAYRVQMDFGGLHPRRRWRLLINLSETLGYAWMATDFRGALENEEGRLASVRDWLSEKALRRRGLKTTKERHTARQKLAGLMPLSYSGSGA